MSAHSSSGENERVELHDSRRAVNPYYRENSVSGRRSVAGGGEGRHRSHSRESSERGRRSRRDDHEHVEAHVEIMEAYENTSRNDDEGANNVGTGRPLDDGSYITIDQVGDRVNTSTRRIDTSEQRVTGLDRSDTRPSGSTPIRGGLGSLSTRKRRLELRAAEERLKIRRTILAEQERAAIELVNKRLELELQELEEDDVVEGRQNEFVREERNRSRERNESFTGREIDTSGGENSANASSIRELTQAITTALQVTRGNRRDDHVTHHLVSRLTSSRDLPTFEGDPVEWPRFKRAFESSTQRGGYSEEENAARLYQSLRKEAKDAVAALMITSCSATQIMEALELRFGNPDLVAQKVVKEIKKLPKIGQGRGNLVTIATTVRNSVAALEAINHIGYLHSPELATEIIGKMPENLIHNYNRFYAENHSRQEPRLIVLARFLVMEAEIACRAGTVELTSRHQRSESSGTTSRRASENRGYEHRRYEKSLTTTGSSERPTEGQAGPNENRRRCEYCKNTRHSIANCEKFTSLAIRRRWAWVKEADICFKCLTAGHRRTQCTAKSCSRSGCQRPHHTLLHSENTGDKTSTEKRRETNQRSQSATESQATTNTWVTEERRVLLQVVPVTLRGPCGSVRTFALLDGGSTVTLIDADVADKLGATGEKSTLHLQGANSMESLETTSARVSLTATGDGATNTCEIIGARTVKNLRLPCQSLDEQDLRGHRHLEAVRVRCYSNASPTILIGQDHWNLITPIEVRAAERSAPVASRTPLGWAIHGYASARGRQSHRKNGDKQRAVINTVVDSEKYTDAVERPAREDADAELYALVKSSLTLEGMGVTSHHRNNSENQRAEKIMSDTTRRYDGRWETGLLWRNDHIILPDSRTNAYNRLKTLEKRMRKDRDFKRTYQDQIQHLIDQGYARKLPSSESLKAERVWYLPHFGVVNKNKPGKTRVVFDAAAKVQGVCLNDALMSGPDLLRSLPGVVMKFRQREIAFTADIREMFLQVKIREEDQYAQLFLWRNGNSDREPETYCMTSMIFGAKSSPASAQYVKNRNAEEFEHEHSRAVSAIKNNHYMDDYLDSVDTEEEAIKLIREVTMIHRSGGFELRGWQSNSRRVITATQGKAQAEGDVSLTPNDNIGTRTLGLKWFPTSDKLSFALSTDRIPRNIQDGTVRPTKRQMLQIIMSVFDPLGFLAPYVIGSRVLMQRVWRAGTGWDEQITEELFEQWLFWLRGLSDIPRCAIPRCYTFEKNVTSTELHVFCDASEDAMATTAYWRFRKCDDSANVAFIISKIRVAPLKMLSIPRMELQAAVMASRIAKIVAEEHDFKITKRVFWTDSRVVWYWINRDARSYKTWVANRLGEIDEATDKQEWRWVPSDLNPADDATRCMAGVPSPESRWFQGPAFLRDAECYWPQSERDSFECTGEERKSGQVLLITEVGAMTLPDVTRFSSWMRLIRTTAWILLLPDKVLRKTASEPSAEHLARAELLWARQVQQESFTSEYLALKNSLPLGKQSRLRQLNPLLDDDDVMRAQGRISAAPDVQNNVKMPIILDGRHPYTRLRILRYHQDAGHSSPETVLNELRQRYWVINARRTIRTVTTSCRWCRIQNAVPRIPRMGELPKARMAHHQRPFTYCGVDYFGPMFVTIGRRREKRWGVLFTCLTTRAVHLEMAASLSTDSAILACRRFVARRGQPTEIFSDNGTNFRGADAELRRAILDLDESKLLTEAANRGMKWNFIPPSAPHMGGCWERLIRSVKTALRVSLKERAPKEEVLATLLVEAEHSVNSRPLTRVSADVRDSESLTPNHFLIGSSSGAPVPGRFSKDDYIGKRQWRVSQHLADMFWSRWIREYLPTLIPRKRWYLENKPLQEGDVVLLVEPTTPRNIWPRGLITRLLPGADGRIRVVEVTSGGRTFLRPATKIIPLEAIEIGTEENISRTGGEDVTARAAA